ncbi:MAG: CDP-glucose 4,6-dehydratase [Chitinophagaceae bacterium]|nr:CDP-glucose 4,6-dehydratase [Chitinophagaceae bacterium]
MEFGIYKDKKVFLTGHTGFKGSWMLVWLNMLGADVKGYALEPLSEPELYNQVKGNELCNSVIADIRDKDRVEKEITGFEPDFIFHFAAQPLVRLSYEIPSYTFEVNAIGTAHVLDALKKLKKPCSVIIITTDKVYENFEWHYPYRETDRLGGYDPYSASKACAEIIISSYRNSFFNKKNFSKHHKGIASARAGNVIGGGDMAKDRIVPDIIRALQNNEPVVLRNPAAVRPWQHVLEPLAGYLQLGKKIAEEPSGYADAWNFGPHNNDNLTVKELAGIALEIWGSGTIKEQGSPDQLHEAGLLKLDINKALAELNWSPKMDARQAIDMTINWYKNLKNCPARKLVENDIAAYNKNFF